VALALCGVIGIATSIAFVYITQYYTEYRYRPVKSIAAASVTARRPTSSRGSRWRSSAPRYDVHDFPPRSSRPKARRVERPDPSGLFGTAVATMGMLGTAAYILAMTPSGHHRQRRRHHRDVAIKPEDIRKRTDGSTR